MPSKAFNSAAVDVTAVLPRVSPGVVIVPLKVALPASDISNVKAEIVEPPSLPLSIKSLSETSDFKIKSPPLLSKENKPTVVPPSRRFISPPSASKLISPATSNVREPELKSISVPSIFILSTVTPPLAVTVVKVPAAGVVPPITAPSIA